MHRPPSLYRAIIGFVAVTIVALFAVPAQAGITASGTVMSVQAAPAGTLNARGYELGTGGNNERFSIATTGTTWTLRILNTHVIGTGVDSIRIITAAPVAVPEPGTWALFALGALAWPAAWGGDVENAAVARPRRTLRSRLPPRRVGGGMKVLANSVQKSGTHLLLRLLESLGLPRYPNRRIDPEWTLERSPVKRGLIQSPLGKRVPIGMGIEISGRWVRRLFDRMPAEAALLAHCAHSPQMATIVRDAGARTVCIVRDPRDVAVSHAHFLMRIGKRKITRRPEHRALVALPDHAARITALLRGHGATRSIAQRFHELLPWRGERDALFVRFEDLVGARGGGDAARQLVAIRAVAEHVGRPQSEEQAQAIASDLFGGTATFRKGTVGQWREELTGAHLALVHETLDDVLVRLGYEDGPDWDSGRISPAGV